MKKFYVFFISIALLLGSYTAIASENSLIIATADWKPYIGSDMQNNGYVADIAAEAMKRVGYDVVYKFHPWKRALLLAEKGKTDGVLGATYSKSRAEYLEFPQPISKIHIHFFHRREKKILYTTLKDLEPYRIGVIRGSMLETKFRQSGLATDAAVHQEQNLKKLLIGRIDLIIAAAEQSMYILKNNFPQDRRNEISIVNPPYKKNDVYLAFSKKHPLHKKIAKDFSRGLSLIHNDGTYKKIIEKHGISIL